MLEAEDRAPRWEAVPTSAYMAEAVWDDGSVVYNLADGGLTAFSVTATEVLKQLRGGSASSTVVLAERLLGVVAESSELQQLEGILAQLQLLGLVRNPPV